MAQVISCPNCRRRGTVPESMIGKKIHCRKCGEVFLAISDGDTDPQTRIPNAQARASKQTEHPDDMVL